MFYYIYMGFLDGCYWYFPAYMYFTTINRLLENPDIHQWVKPWSLGLFCYFWHNKSWNFIFFSVCFSVFYLKLCLDMENKLHGIQPSRESTPLKSAWTKIIDQWKKLSHSKCLGYSQPLWLFISWFMSLYHWPEDFWMFTLSVLMVGFHVDTKMIDLRVIPTRTINSQVLPKS